MPLPHFRLTDPQRVCDQCYNQLAHENALNQHQQQQAQQQSSQPQAQQHYQPPTQDYAAPTQAVSPPAAARPTFTSAAPARPGGFGSFSGFGRSSTYTYNLSGNLEDQLRQAIKNGDATGVKQLLDAGADANYVDHTKNSLLHLAAMFDKFEIAKLLLDKGANVDAKNMQNESPIDLAPPAMAHKMKAYAQTAA